MKSHCKNLQLAGIDVVLPALVSIEGRQPDRPKPMHVIAGFAAEEVDGIIPALVGQWLSQLCHRHFMETGRGDAGDLAAEAFYDKLAATFSHHASLVAILIPQSCTVRLANGRFSSPLASVSDLARWKFRGRVRAYLNPGTAAAQVTFDELPGGITLASRDSFAPSVCRMFERSHEVSAWYGFGVPVCDPAEAIMMLRDEIADPRRTAIASRASAHV